MNKKYEKYINYIVNELEPPYFKNMRDQYGLSPDEYKLVLSKIFGEPVNILNLNVFNSNDDLMYYEDNKINRWAKYKYDSRGNVIYSVNSEGKYWKNEYDEDDNLIYQEVSGVIKVDNR